MSSLPLSRPSRLAPLQPLQPAQLNNPVASTTAIANFAKAPLAAPTKLASQAPAETIAANIPAATNESTEADLQQLLGLVRKRYPDQPSAGVSESSASSAAAIAVSVPPAVLAVPAVSVSTAVATSSSFSDAANGAQVDKLAVLMSLFKSRGIEPPPLPLFERFDTLETVEPQKPKETTEKQNMQVATAAPIQSQPPSIASPSASSTAAEVAQLSTLFLHARTKLLKLCRLYRSGVLQGAGASQALIKLTTMLRTYYGFIQQAKNHPHIDAMEGEIAADIRCESLQQLADRMYAKAME